MTNKSLKIICFGEILWDVFPDKTLLGGAPLNVAMRLHSLGAQVTMVSSVGIDDRGHKAIQIMEDNGLSTHGVSRLEDIPTGQVLVSLSDGIAEYSITENAAWDHIIVSEEIIAEVKVADALVFGSLALRQPANREVLIRLLAHSSYSIFDLNLRSPYYSEETIIDLLKKPDFVKMNDEELDWVCETIGITTTNKKDQLKQLGEYTNASTICVTLGKDGAMVAHNSYLTSHPGYKVKVADTVGAGDAFLAGLIFKILSKTSVPDALNLACALGATVASKAGANCTVTTDELELLIHK